MALSGTKICNICGIEKQVHEFYKIRGKYYKGYCKACSLVLLKEWRRENHEHYLKSRREYQKIKYREDAEFRNKTLASTKRWTLDNPEKCKEIKRKYDKDNLKRAVERTKKYQKKHKGKPKFILNRRMRDGIRHSLKSKKKNKGGRHWEELVGYTVEDLKNHLESLFTNGMSWENYGEWHIDHRIPISVFNFNDASHIDFKRCWGLNNLQPMYAKENIIKSNKLEMSFQPCLAL
ncbi:MAG TPA: hypothetical protein ENH82_07560 [bacterium]|nr:hypothetical protein [bacterium]